MLSREGLMRVVTDGLEIVALSGMLNLLIVDLSNT